ncbi:MAG: hypothetical protein V4621_04150 [Pseudomonadota bacterium]
MVKKYLFDLHRFDSPHAQVDIAQDDAAPSPTYSHDDLTASQDDAFRRGRQEGFRESEEGISREIATFLGILNTQLDDLLRAETQRSEAFAKDVLVASQALYAQTSATLIKAESWPLTVAMIQDVITAMPRNQDMIITIPELYRETLSQYLTKMYGDKATRFQIEADPLLPAGDCKITWAHGGAIQSMTDMQALIHERLQLLLAEIGATTHHDANTPTTDKDQPHE